MCVEPAKHILLNNGIIRLSLLGCVQEMKQKMKKTHEKEHMAVAKVVELIGSSPDGWEAATANAVEAAAQTIRNIKGVDVRRCTAKVANNKIVEYRAVVKIAFIVERE